MSYHMTATASTYYDTNGAWSRSRKIRWPQISKAAGHLLVEQRAAGAVSRAAVPVH